MPFERKLRVKTLTADYTVTERDHMSIFVMGSGADIEITLPAASGMSGVIVEFYNAQNYEMKITGPDEGIVAFNDATADAINITTANEHIGASARFFCDGSLWYYQNLNAGAAQTVTVVSA